MYVYHAQHPYLFRLSKSNKFRKISKSNLFIWITFVFMPSSPDTVGEGIVFYSCPVGTFVHSSVQILLPQYLMKG